MVYRVEATHNEYDHILADHRETKDARGDIRFIVGPHIAEDWTAPHLIYAKGTKKIRPNLMAYDQGAAFAADDEAIEKLALRDADWCRLVSVRADALDHRYKPLGIIEFTLLAVIRLVDAVDRSRTTFKPYGDEILKDHAPDETFFHREKLPTAGMVHHKSGASTSILTYDDDAHPDESFKRLFEASGLTGVKFIPVGQV
jgi:hypothetical protein